MDEPVADTVRGILDGHIVLSRDLAQAYHYPAIDVLQSVSRCAPDVSGSASKIAEGIIRKNMASYAKVEVAISVGAYPHGSNPETDEAIAKHDPIEKFLIQDIDDPSSLEQTLCAMSEITGVEIPEDEMADTNAKLVQNRAVRKVKETKEERMPVSVDDNAMALNSVASLFSSLPGTSVFG